MAPLPKYQTAIEIINDVIVPQVDANTKDIQAITKEVILNEKNFKKDVTDIYNVLEKKEEDVESKMEVSRAEYIKYCKELETEIKNLVKQITSDKSEEDLGKIVDELSVKVEALENDEAFEYDDQELKDAVTKLNVDFNVFKEKLITSKSVIDEINSKPETIEASSIKGLIQTLNNIANLGGNSNVKVSGSILEVLNGGTSIMQGVTRLNFTNATVTNNNGTINITTTGGGGTGITWNEVTGTSQSAAINNGYVSNNAGLVTVTLPTIAALGSIIEVAGNGAGGWKIAQPASVSINFGNQVTTTGTGGSLASVHRYDAVRLLCITANTGWSVLSSVGNITVV